MEYVFSTDKELHIISWGEELAELTGKKSSEAQGKEYFEVLSRIFSGDDDALSLVIEKKRRLVLKRYNFRCLLSHINADVRISPVRSAGSVEGAKVTLSSVTPCPVARSLQNSQRFIDIGKTASTLAHGVRNPLNAIKGAVVYLSEKYAGEPDLVEFAKIMKEEISRLDNFISRFLSTSISDAGFTMTDINSLLKRLEAFTSLQAQACDIKFVYEFGEVPPLMVNTFQIEQAVLNVLNNAIDAMRSGGRLVVRTRMERTSTSDFVTIEVSDTGSGIAGKVLDVASVPSGGKGKGFGLFITREVLRYHGGHLEIKSKKGRGTSVRLYLPTRNDRTVE